MEPASLVMDDAGRPSALLQTTSDESSEPMGGLSRGSSEPENHDAHRESRARELGVRPPLTRSSSHRMSFAPIGRTGDVGAHCHRNLRRMMKKERSLRRGGGRKSNSLMGGFEGLDGDPLEGNLPCVKETTPLRKSALEQEIIKGDAEEQGYDTVAALRDLIFGKILNVLLLFIPLAWASHRLGWSSQAVFWLNFFAMVPLASILGDFTEEVAAHTSQTIGGLINATFGNAVEVVVGIQALLANEIRVVQASMIGSIFSNLLLVLGGCFFFGGLRHKEQRFNSTAATANMALLALSSMALVLPTPFAEYYEVEDEHVLVISRIVAVFLIFMYAQLLVFQLKTHAHLFEDDDEDVTEMPFWTAITGLLVVTLLIAKLSDYLVESIDGFCTGSGVSRTFVGLIILPIVGNAVEHITAITVAMKNKMDLAMGVAVGSCTQISLFVIPVTVLVGWATDKSMTLNFPHFEIILFVLSVVIVSICISNPKSNWLEGSLLMTTYLMIAVGFWYEKVRNF